MDWAGIEELVYSEASDPGRLLGEHVIKEGLLIQAFLPNAEKVSVKIGEEQFPMEMADENGFFAVLLDDRRELVPYHFCITYTDGDNEEIIDPYSYQFHTAFTEEEVRKSIMIPMRNSGHIRRWKPGSRAFTLRCGRRMRCASALWAISTSGTEDATR